VIQVLVLLLVSALVAYLGDILGTWVGKRRLTLFNLRPRVTALLVAISTGVLITLLTLTFSAILSENVRIALFSVQQLSEERNRLTQEVAGLDKERKRLKAHVTDLTSQVRVKQEELVVFRKDEPLAAKVILAKRLPGLILDDIHAFMDNLAARARERGVKVKGSAAFLSENAAQMTRMAGMIASSPGDMIVAAVAARNINVGESLGDVRFLVLPNDLIFKASQEIASVEIDGSLDRPAIAKFLRDFMEEINHEVVKQGMIGNPLTGRFGDLSSESMLSFYDMVNQIRSLGRKLVLVAVVKEDTNAIGPLNASFRLEEESGD